MAKVYVVSSKDYSAGDLASRIHGVCSTPKKAMDKVREVMAENEGCTPSEIELPSSNGNVLADVWREPVCYSIDKFTVDDME